MIRMQSGCGVSSSCCAAGPPDGHARQPAGCTAAISSRRSRGRSADLRFATYALPQIPEIAPTGKALIGLWPCELVKRDPLGPGIRQLSTGAVRDLETHGNFHLAVAELCNRPIKIGHSVAQDRLISLEMLGEQQKRRMRIQRTIATRVPNASIAKTNSAPNRRLKCVTSAATSRLGR